MNLRTRVDRIAGLGHVGWMMLALLALVLSIAPPSARAQSSTGGTVVAWGDNNYGQTSVPSSLSDVTAIAAGDFHSLALKRDGTVVAWGGNDDGQTNVPSGLSDVVAIAGGYFHSLALKRDGTVVAWGDGLYGQTNVPSGLSDVTAIAAGYEHSLALKRDGTVIAWGRNRFGQTSVPSGLSGVTAIAAGSDHNLAIKRDGSVVAWGGNGYGQTSVPSGLSDVTAIAAGGSHSLAIKRDGSVVAWGGNDDGQTNVPSGLSDVVAIAAGRGHNLALKRDGTVVAWGQDYIGQTNVPSGLSNVTAIAASGYHNLALVVSDTSAPDTTFTGQPATLSASRDASFSFSSSEAGSSFACSLDGATFAACTSPQSYNGLADGSHSFQVRATDLAGNTDASPASATWMIDANAPTANPSQSPAANGAGWNNGDVTVSWNWNDSTSGLDASKCPSSSTSSGEGTIALMATCSDLAGNTGNASSTVKVDKTKPIISAAVTSAPNANGWYNAPVTVRFSCADALSGIPQGACPADQTLSTEGAAITSSAQTVSDAAGNTSDASSVVPVKIDTTAPATSGSASTSGNGATVTLVPSDNLSGVASTRYSVNGGAAQSYSGPFVLNGAGNYTIAYASMDMASNVEANKILNVTIAQSTNAVLDNFNRTTGIGANWEGLTGSSFYKVTANQLDVEAGGPLVWKAAFGTAQEAFVTLSTIDPKSPAQGLLLKVQTGSVPDAGAISVTYDAKAKAIWVSTLRLGAKAWTLYPSKAATFANGDVLKARALANGDVQVYKNGTLLTTVTLNSADKTFFNAKGGKIGIWTAAASKAVLDDFGGGTVTP